MCGWNPQKLPSVTGTEASSCHLLGAYSAMFYVVAIEVTEASWAIEVTEASWCHWYRSLLVTFCTFGAVSRGHTRLFGEYSVRRWYVVRSFLVSLVQKLRSVILVTGFQSFQNPVRSQGFYP
jgi:hypothetical protein